MLFMVTAHNTTEAKGGKIYIVTNPADTDMVNPPPGTLRHAVLQPEPLWIIFSGHMNIKLCQELIFESHKTIDGRGFHIHIAGGAGIMLQNIRNIIISNIHMYDIAPAKGGMIRSKADHALLFGASDATPDENMRVTLAYNHFGKGLTQRLPAVRWGFVHVVNNANKQSKEVTHRNQAEKSEWCKWTWRSEGDLMLNGAFFVSSGNPHWAHHYKGYPLIKAEPAHKVHELTNFAGAALGCRVGLPC
ncbi:pectate lyase-like protein [Tanacetum coccineum]